MTPLAVAVSLHRGYPTWFFFLMLFACMGLVAYFYVNNARALPRGYFALLLVMRVLVVLVLLLFIFQPELILTHFLTRKPKMLVLVDVSRSMSHADEGTGARLSLARTLLERGRLLSTLEDQFDVGLFQFGAKAEPIRYRDLDSLQAADDLTDLTAACAGSLNSLGQRARGSAAGIVLLTDGIDNSGKRPADKLAELGVPIYPIGFGLRIEEQENLKNVAITNVEYDDFVPKDNTTEIKVLVDAQGYGNHPARVVLLDKKTSKELASQDVVLDSKKGAQQVVLKFTPKEIGRIDGAIEVPQLPQEARLSDNRQSVTINVTGPRIKVLYIEGVLRPEGRWLMRTLQTDPNVDLLYLVRSTEGKFLQRGNLKGITLDSIPSNLQTWKRFNVFILGDVHRSLFTSNQLEDLKEAVEDNRGLLLMGGVTALGPGKYGETPVEVVSPVWFGTSTIGQENEPFIWQLADDGQVHPIFAGIARFFPTRDREAEVPLQQKLSGCTRVGALKPNATVLAVHPSAKGPDGKPLVVIATMNPGTFRSMVVTADTTHHWYLPNRALGRENPYVKLWGQAIRWLASEESKRDDKPGITAYTDKAEYEPGRDVRLLALVRDPRGQATGEATVTVSILGPSKERTRLILPRVDGKLGEYRGDFRPASPGPHEAVFEARLGDERLGEPQTIKFSVGAPDLEMAELSLNETLLKQIADRTAGRYCTWLGLNDLASTLSAEQNRRTEPVKLKLHHGPTFLLFFILVAACEWYMRKRIQLA